MNLSDKEKELIVSAIQENQAITKEYILQKRYPFAPVFQDVEGDYSKAETRVIYTWLP